MKFTKRRAISQIIGTMMMVAIVASVGSALMFQGIDGINEFNSYMQGVVGITSNSARELILIEHVRMDPATSGVEIYVTNYGSVDVLVRSVKMLKIDTQHLLFDNDISELIPIGTRIMLNDPGGVTANLSKLPVGGPVDPFWSNSLYSAQQEYLISITTAEGSSFQKAVSAFNT